MDAAVPIEAFSKQRFTAAGKCCVPSRSDYPVKFARLTAAGKICSQFHVYDLRFDLRL
jgi:hypothetical protein